MTAVRGRGSGRRRAAEGAAGFAIGSADELEKRLRTHGYLLGAEVATPTFLALRMGKPLLLEGDPGVGKTALALALSQSFGAELVRLQCYEGLDMAQAAYEWNYPRQLLEIRLAEARGEAAAATAASLFDESFLLERPLLRALRLGETAPVVLLIDELDRADEPFEAFLLEFLGDFQLSIPELGTRRTTHRPAVVITSNRTREIHDAIRRRCLYCMLSYPPLDREIEIVLAHLPGIARELATQVAAFVAEVRELTLFKRPGIAETLDWCKALCELDRGRLDADTVQTTLGALLKYEDDIARVDAETTAQLLGQAAVRAAALDRGD